MGRFFETYPPCGHVTSVEVVPTKTEIDKSSVNLFLKDVRDRLNVSKKNLTKYVIAQKDIDRFWNVLMRQKFDLVDHDIWLIMILRFAGEAGADMGGPLWEFFTLTMKCFQIYLH